MRHLFKVAARALGVHSRTLMSDAQKAGLREAESYVNKGEIETAASKYNEWWQQNSSYLKSAEFSQDPESRSEFAKKLPKMLKAFWKCKCDDDCKDHIEESAKIAPEALRPSFYSAAAFGGIHKYDPKSVELQKEILSSAGEKEYRELILGKNGTGQNLIEIAFLRDNPEFVRLAKDLFGIPTKMDIRDMEYLEYFCRLKDRDVDPEFKDLLLGGDIIGEDIA